MHLLAGKPTVVVLLFLLLEDPLHHVQSKWEKAVKVRCVCVGYSQTKATQRKCHILSIGYILCLKKYVSAVLSDMLKKGERKQSSEPVPVLLPR